MPDAHLPGPDEKPVPVGIGLVCRDGHFLARRRPERTVYAGYWEFPGGKSEPGERSADTVARECLEETGLRVSVGPCRRVVLHRYPHGLVELHFHDCTPVDRAADPAPETGFAWIPARMLPTLRFPEANEAVIGDLAREADPRT